MKFNLYLRLGIFILVLAVLFFGGWVWWQDAVAAVNPTDTSAVVFVVKKGEGVKAITSRLYQQNLIRSSTGFYLTVKQLGIEKDIEAGEFRLNRGMSASELARQLTHGIEDTWVTTIEGWRMEEMATKLAGDLNIPEQEFLKYSEEGYMFPDTYLVPQDATAAAIVALFRTTFDKKFTSEMQVAGEKSGLNQKEIVTLASIVEREGNSDTDRPVIAGILLNRLEAEWPLQADATVQYALGYQPREKSWWKKNLTKEDLEVDSRYNTYKYPGLPPGPISNPGLSALKAVASPTRTEYWYYLHDPTGQVHYGKTLEEHQANIAKFLKS